MEQFTAIKITDIRLTKKDIIPRGFQLLLSSLFIQRTHKSNFFDLCARMGIGKRKARELWNECFRSDFFRGGKGRWLYHRSVGNNSEIKRCYYRKEKDGIGVSIPIGVSNWQTVNFNPDEVEGIWELRRIFKRWIALAKGVSTLDKDGELVLKSQSSIGEEIGIHRTTAGSWLKGMKKVPVVRIEEYEPDGGGGIPDDKEYKYKLGWKVKLLDGTEVLIKSLPNYYFAETGQEFFTDFFDLHLNTCQGSLLDKAVRSSRKRKYRTNKKYNSDTQIKSWIMGGVCICSESKELREKFIEIGRFGNESVKAA